MFSLPLLMYLGIQESIKTRSIPNFLFNWGDGIVPYRLWGQFGDKQQPSFRLTLTISQEKYNFSMLYWIFYLSLQFIVGIARIKMKHHLSRKKINKKHWKSEQKSQYQPKKKAPNFSVKAQDQFFFLQNTTHPTHPPAFVSGCQRSMFPLQENSDTH